MAEEMDEEFSYLVGLDSFGIKNWFVSLSYLQFVLNQFTFYSTIFFLLTTYSGTAGYPGEFKIKIVSSVKFTGLRFVSFNLSKI